MKDGALNDTGSILFRNITSIITTAQLPSSAVFVVTCNFLDVISQPVGKDFCTLSAKFSQFCSLWLFYFICDL